MAVRPLTDHERAVLLRLLSVSLDSAEVLREQVMQASVVGSVGPSIDVSVDSSAPRALLPDGPLPITADVVDVGDQYIGELLVWLKDGQLAALEYAWVTNEPPATLPPPSSLRVTCRC